MNTIQIEESLELLVQDVASGACPLHDLPFRLMEAYDASRNEVNKLRMKHPAGLVSTDVLWPKKMLYRPATAGDVQAINYFVANNYIEALGKLATSPNQKVLMLPVEASSVIGSIGGIAEIARETFGGGAPGAPVRPSRPPSAVQP